MPRVSVIIPTFNCAQFLDRALRTALAQTYKDYEIIVVDDGSTDETKDVIAQHRAKVHYLYQPNRGPASARNLALSAASGEFVAYLDADDMWYPHKLERQVAFLDTHKECGLVHSDMTVIDAMDQPLYLRFNQETQREIPSGHCIMTLLRWNHIQTVTVLERRDSIERVGKFDERLKIIEDGFHWILVAMAGMAFGYIDEPLALYRRRADSLSSNERQMAETYVLLFEILLTEKALALRCGQEAADIVRARLHACQRCLVYLDRLEGRTGQARQRVLHLIQNSPWHIELYAELLKSCVPPALATKLRRLREYPSR
jgi:glycosyltransferase involved in cell wall biosynthesis